MVKSYKPYLKWAYAYIVAGSIDILQMVFFVLELTPAYLVVNTVGIVMLAPVIGKYAFIDALEFIPLEGYLPTFTASVVLANIKVLGEPFSPSMKAIR